MQLSNFCTCYFFLTIKHMKSYSFSSLLRAMYVGIYFKNYIHVVKCCFISSCTLYSVRLGWVWRGAHLKVLCIFTMTGRDSKIHVFRLTDFEGDPTSVSFEDRVRSKVDLKDHKLERTKGCHLYAISRPGGSHLRMVRMKQSNQEFHLVFVNIRNCAIIFCMHCSSLVIYRQYVYMNVSASLTFYMYEDKFFEYDNLLSRFSIGWNEQ